jgi:hemerythrin-like domain-containing protein
MLSHATQLLADDHTSVDAVLTLLRAALKKSDVEATHAALDLFWARLAVHIRAEHLHLFPTVLKRIAEPSLNEAETTVAELRSDHDFFMHELARAIAIARELSSTRHGLDNIREIVASVEERLRRHNAIEEQKIYRWAGEVLNEAEQAQLGSEIRKELTNRPQRFSETDWSR